MLINVMLNKSMISLKKKILTPRLSSCNKYVLFWFCFHCVLFLFCLFEFLVSFPGC